MKTINERQLQYEIISWYRKEFPSKKERLVATFNEITGGVKQAMQRRSLGLQKGLSDLLFFTDAGYVEFIELKFDGNRHNKAHLQSQVDFGVSMLSLGHRFFFVQSLDQFKNIIYDRQNKDKGISVGKMQQIINESNTKTIKL